MSEQTTPKTVNAELTDQELSEVAAGLAIPDSGHTLQRIYSDWCTQVGTEDSWDHTITYCPCPRCGKPMHSEFWAAKWYCDPCNFIEFNPRTATWTGTADELIAAAG